MTAVEWLMQTLEQNNIIDLDIIDSDKYYTIIDQAKEMHKLDIENAYSRGKFDYEDYSKGIKEKVKQSRDYYNETYGSKGSDVLKNGGGVLNQVGDVLKSSQKEISEKEILNEATDRYVIEDEIEAFIQGAEWYREQLKSRQ